MDILQVALVFLIILLSIFFAVLGFQVFLILRDLRKDLNKFDKLLRSEISQAEEVEIIPQQARNIIKTPSLKPRFYKRVLK